MEDDLDLKSQVPAEGINQGGTGQASSSLSATRAAPTQRLAHCPLALSCSP
jgi:hypothetical protein